VNSTQVVLLNSPSLTSSTGTMFGTVSYSSQSSYLQALDTDNSPVYINNLRNITNVNVRISDHTYTSYPNTNVNYICILHFTEIQGEETPRKTSQNPTLTYKGL
jgi:hypothetical protein